MELLKQFEFFAAWMRAKFGQDEIGASLVEYALLVALIAVAAIVGMQVLGGKANEKLESVGSVVGGASAGG